MSYYTEEEPEMTKLVTRYGIIRYRIVKDHWDDSAKNWLVIAVDREDGGLTFPDGRVCDSISEIHWTPIEGIKNFSLKPRKKPTAKTYGPYLSFWSEIAQLFDDSILEAYLNLEFPMNFEDDLEIIKDSQRRRSEHRVLVREAYAAMDLANEYALQAKVEHEKLNIDTYGEKLGKKRNQESHFGLPKM